MGFFFGLKLGEKTEIVFGKEADIVDVVAKERKTLDSHSPGIAGIDFRIDAAVFENFRMDHAGSGNFKPAGFFTEAAAFAFTVGAADIDF